MAQVEVFKTGLSEGHAAPRRESHQASRPAPKPAGTSSAAKPGLKKPLFASKSSEAKAPVGIGAGNGHDRRRKEDDFEEF